MRVVIVGHGMAGARLATELRAVPETKVTVIGAEPHPAYNRILLSKVLAGRATERDVELTDAAGADVRAGVTVTAIDRAARTVATDAGEAVEYDQLVLATGGRAVVPPIPGLAGAALPPRVAVFRTLDDCRRILALAAGATRAVVLGGGPLGLEAARALATRGLDAHVVQHTGHLMDRQLDPGAGVVLAATLARLGVTAHVATTATAVAAGADGVTLALGGGARLRADLLVLACGVRADTALAGAAGLAVDRGVLVDDRLRTSDPRVFAIGDCARHGDEPGGLVAPAWEQARVVARVLAGEAGARYRPVPVVTRLKASGVDLAAMGDTAPAVSPAEELVFADPARGTYARLVIAGGRIAGAVLLGDNPSVGTVIQLFDRGAPVPSDRRALLLGRAVGGAAPATADSPTLMPDAATVCRCNAVTKAALVRCWRGGARTVGEMAAGTRATTGCGTCRAAVEGIVGWLSSQDSDPHGAEGAVA